MKKAISILLVLVMILSLCACGQNDTNPTTEPDDQPDATVPSEPESNVMEMAVAVNDGKVSEYHISDGNAYIIDVSNDMSENTWSVSIPVGEDFALDEIEYIGCCDESYDFADIQIRCELLDSTLTIRSGEAKQDPDSAYDSLYLIIVSGKISAGEKVRYVPHNDGNTAGAEIRTIEKMTGELVFSERKSNFSEGFCWAELVYSDTGKKITAVIDTNGRVISEFTDEWLVSYGDFHNGVSMLEYESGVRMFVDTESNILFYSDNPDYQDMIKGIYPGGYIFLVKTEANLTSSTTYYAIMDCSKNYIIDWTAYDGFWLFNYMGGDVFAFLDGFRRGDRDTVKLYNAETKVWTTVKNIDGGSLWRVPDLVAENADGWLVIGSGLDRVSGGGILVSTKNGKTYTLDSDYEYGIPSEDRIVVIDTGYYDDDLKGFGYVNTKDGSHDMVDYEYLHLVQKKKRTMETMFAEAYLELGYWPANNYFSTVPQAACQTTNTYLYDYAFTNGVMLLQLKGADGYDYYALMNEQGKNVIEPVKGKAAATLGQGRFLVSRDDGLHIINESGEDVAIRSEKDCGSLFSADAYRDGLSWVETSGNVNGFIDVNGNYVFGEGDVLQGAESVKLSAISVSTELVEKEPAENVTDPTGEYRETPVSAFEYEYGKCEVKLPDGSRDRVDAVMITKYVGNDEIVVIPAEIGGFPVLKIAESAFSGSEIKELYFAGNLTVIEARAFFGCKELTTVVLPDHWMYLGNACFSGCTSLERLEIPADCSFDVEEVWNEELKVYQYVTGSPISESDSTVVAARGE